MGEEKSIYEVSPEFKDKQKLREKLQKLADYEALKELIEETEVNAGDRPSEVLADSGFSSYENLAYLEGRDIKGYMPDQEMESIRKGTCKNPEFHKSRFKYNGVTDRYTCPMGKLLTYKVHIKG